MKEKPALWYKDVLDSMTDFVLVKGDKSRLLWANKSFLDYYGMSTEDLENFVDAEHSDPDDTIQYVKDDHFVFHEKKPLEVVEPITKHDGSIGEFHTIKSPILLENGEVERTIGVSRPVKTSEYIKLEIEKRHAQKQNIAQIKSLASKMPSILVMLDSQSRIICMSKKAEREFMVGSKDVVGEQLRKTLPFAQAIESEIRAALEQKREFIGSQIHIDHKILRPHIDPWFLSDEEPGGVTIIFQDETFTSEEKVRKERELQTLNDRFNLALQASSIAVWDFNVEANAMSWDDSVFRMFGRDPHDEEDPLGIWSASMEKADQRRFFEAMQRSLKAESRFDETYRIQLPNGGDRYIRSIADVVYKENGIHLIGICQDITTDVELRKSLERSKKAAEASLVARSAFLANMSHELRTPLNGILGMSAELKEEVQTREINEKVSIIEDSGITLLKILNDILDMSKIESGKFSLAIAPMRIDSLLKKIQLYMTSRAKEKALKIAVEVESDLSPLYMGDELRILQILMNLTSNAIKFTNFGSVKLSIEEISADQYQSVLKFSVSDTGLGIAKEGVAKIFQPFFQADASTTRAYGGTGLGLSISQDLAKQMGSEIEVKSIPGQGSTFAFSICLLKADQNTQLPFEKLEEGCLVDGKIDLSHVSVLIVEDNKVNQKVMMSLLKKMGASPDCAAEGVEAVGKAGEKNYDLIFMDCHMPVMDGFEATRKIKLKAKNPPYVIAITASAMKEDQEKCYAAGMDGFVSKPNIKEKLRKQILIALQTKSLLNPKYSQESGPR